MKLVKLSLAAVVAAGSFSFANAVALDEAIQNVDLSGYLRYRYDSKSLDKKIEKASKTNSQTHKYKAQLKLTADIAENFKATAVMQYGEVEDGSYGSKAVLNDDVNGKSYFQVRDAYLTYSNFDTDISFGRMTVGSFWTDDLLGTGIKAVNNSIEGVTLAAYMFDNYNADDDLHVNTAKNLYGIAAMVDFEPVAAELWVSHLASYATLYAVDLRADLGDEDLSYYAHAQVAGSAVDSDRKKKNPKTGVKTDKDYLKNGMLWGIELGANAFGADFNVGYLTFGDKKLSSVIMMEDNGKVMNYGEIVMDADSDKAGKKDFIFGTIGYTYEDLRFGVDIIAGNKKTDGDKFKMFEVNPRLTYNYSEKLSFEAWYANATTKQDSNGNKDKEQRVRLEAKYSF